MKTFSSFLYEMAFTRSVAENKMSELSSPLVEHICKIIADPKNISSKHWMEEVYIWCNKASNIKIKKSSIKKNDIIDWLFNTSISETQETKFKNNIEGLIEIYDMSTKYNLNMWKQYLHIRLRLTNLISDDIVSIKSVMNIFDETL